MKGIKVADGKLVGGKGRLTDVEIDKLCLRRKFEGMQGILRKCVKKYGQFTSRKYPMKNLSWAFPQGEESW